MAYKAHQSSKPVVIVKAPLIEYASFLEKDKLTTNLANYPKRFQKRIMGIIEDERIF